MPGGAGAGGARRGGGRRRRGSRRPMAEINVTPFVDVMLVLLIIFMVSAPLLTPGVAIDLPRSSAAPALPKPSAPPVAVSMRENGEIFYGEDLVDFEGLLRALRAARQAADTPPPVYLRADGATPYEGVADLIAGLSAEGFGNITFILDAKRAAAARLGSEPAETVDIDAQPPVESE